MKETIVKITVSEYRHLLQLNPKAEITKIAAAGSDWNALLPQIRTGMSRVKDPTDMIISMEMPADCSYTKVMELLNMLREYSPSPNPMVWGYKEVDDGRFSIVVYVC